ncbi:MAG: hypothetical protein AVDCRST_MAG58-3341 [uncultured Rubrobacteraceae bacterium]|uniref:DUF6602 domain-containing protein n=1 Tax=uncultured Rubrobacteraceae bacterium TaxID=349277 RepID=A0A6J4R5X2_9ACTN|nr:MAG: hypothetical protein AVDCRST_MAG58-3341 [uncultured Rubrobacteraceae bacterium]
MDDLFALVRTDAEELRLEFGRASIQGRGTPQDIATFRETALQGIVSNYFPFPFRVAKGGIVDSYGRRSDSVDCILVNPMHPYTIDRRENFKLIFADGVDAAIEVKPDISQRYALYRGVVARIDGEGAAQGRNDPGYARAGRESSGRVFPPSAVLHLRDEGKGGPP